MAGKDGGVWQKDYILQKLTSHIPISTSVFQPNIKCNKKDPGT
jgi:hypothetical protein